MLLAPVGVARLASANSEMASVACGPWVATATAASRGFWIKLRPIKEFDLINPIIMGN